MISKEKGQGLIHMGHLYLLVFNKKTPPGPIEPASSILASWGSLLFFTFTKGFRQGRLLSMQTDSLFLRELDTTEMQFHS